jgi:hypothetical protein
LLQVAQKGGSGRDWSQIREALGRVMIEEHRPGPLARREPCTACIRSWRRSWLASACTSSRAAPPRSVPASGPLFEQMKRDASARKFDSGESWTPTGSVRWLPRSESGKGVFPVNHESNWFLHVLAPNQGPVHRAPTVLIVDNPERFD